MSLRRAGDADLDFLRGLYRTFRAEEMLAVAWPQAAKDAFLNDQFRLQHQHYVRVFATADFLVVERAGEPIGRLYLDRGPERFLIVDIGFLPQWRSRGFGRALLAWVQDLARADGARRVELHVLPQNLRARRLYAALGFEDAGVDGAHLRMAWPVS